MATKKLGKGKWCFERSPGHWWFDFKFNGFKRQRGALPGCTNREAAETEAALTRDLFHEQHISKRQTKTDLRPTETIAETLAHYHTFTVLKAGRPEKSVEHARGNADRLVETIGSVCTNEINRTHLFQHRDARRGAEFGPVSDGVIRAEIGALRLALDDARRNRGINVAVVDFDDLNLAGRKKRNVEPWSAQKVNEVSAWVRASHPDYWPALEFTLQVAKRSTNVIGLRWAEVLDVDGAPHGVIRQRVKGGEITTLPLTAATRALIEAERGLHPTYVFTFVARVSNGGGKTQQLRRQAGRRYEISNSAWRRFWISVRTHFNLPDFHFHDLRHVFGTLVLSETKDIRNAQEGLGHADLGTTLQYIDKPKDGALVAAQAVLAARERARTPTPPDDAASRVAELERQLAEAKAQLGGNVVPLRRKAS